jgi:hypothetical protein
MMNKMTMVLGMKSIISKIIVAGAAAAAIAVPAAAARASTSTGFAVQDNGGVLVTTQQVTVGEVLACKGHAETITSVDHFANAYIFHVAPQFGDPSGELTFSAVG